MAKRRLIALFLMIPLMLTACKKEQEEDTNTSSTTTSTAESVELSLKPMTFDKTVKQGGYYFYEFFFDNAEEITLTPEMITLPDGLTAEVSIVKDTTDEDIQTICLEGVQAEEGKYTVNVQGGVGKSGTAESEPFAFEVYVVGADTSPYITLCCVTSKEEVKQGGTLTITGKYTGITSSKSMTYLMDESFIKLSNCTGDLEFTRTNGNLSTCIIFSNIQVTDTSLPCELEILEGSALDVDGTPVNGYAVQFTVV